MFIVFRFTDFLSEKNPRLTGAKRPALFCLCFSPSVAISENGRAGQKG